MFNRKQFKKTAKEQVPNVFTIFLLTIIISLVVEFFTSGSNALNVAMGGRYGHTEQLAAASSYLGLATLIAFIVKISVPYFTSKACLMSARNNSRVDISELFKQCSWNGFFSYFAKTFVAELFIGLINTAIVIVAAIMCCITAGTTAGLGNAMNSDMPYLGQVIAVAVMYVLPMVLLFACISGAVTTVLRLKFILIKYIAIEHPEMGVMDTIKLSGQIMKGNKWHMFIMQLSFFWWYLLSCVTFGIASLYVLPYCKLAETQAYKALYDAEHSTEDKTSDTETIETATAEPASEPAETEETKKSDASEANEPAAGKGEK